LASATFAPDFFSMFFASAPFVFIWQQPAFVEAFVMLALDMSQSAFDISQFAFSAAVQFPAFFTPFIGHSLPETVTIRGSCPLFAVVLNDAFVPCMQHDALDIFAPAGHLAVQSSLL
jgi:hypothetical protein